MIFKMIFSFQFPNMVKILNIDNRVILVGQNKRENWELLNDVVETDVLFHLTSFPSCYVILKNTDKEVDMNTITFCAKICKHNTKFKNLNDIYVDYTYCNNVERGEKVGELIYKYRRRVKKVKIDF